MKIIAHRANNNGYKENSLNAVLSALKLDIDGIELDIRKTKDNYFVLHHNITYKDKIIYKTNLKELELDRLDNVLKKINTNKIILLDLKLENLDIKSYIKYLIKVLNKFRKLNIWLCSFNYGLIKYLKEHTNYKCGLIISKLINSNKEYKIFDFISVNYKIYKKYPIKTMVWTINSEKEMKKFLNKDVFIITDKILLAKRLLTTKEI